MFLKLLLTLFIYSPTAFATPAEDDAEIVAGMRGTLPQEPPPSEQSAILARSEAFRQNHVIPFSRRYQQQLYGIILSYPRYVQQLARSETQILIVDASDSQPRGETLPLENGRSVILLSQQLFTQVGFLDTRLRIGFELSPTETREYTWVSNLLPEDASLSFTYLHELSHHLWINKLTPSQQTEFTQLSWERGAPRDSSILPTFRALFAIPSGAAYPRNPKLGVTELCRSYAALRASPFISMYAMADELEDFADTTAIFLWTQVMKKDWKVRLPAVCSGRQPTPVERAPRPVHRVLNQKYQWVRNWLQVATAPAASGGARSNIFEDPRGAASSRDCFAYRPSSIHSVSKMRAQFPTLQFNPDQSCLSPRLRAGYQAALQKVLFEPLHPPYAYEIGGEGFYHGHILFDVAAYHSPQGRERYQQISAALPALAQGANPNVAVINYLMEQPETIILFHTREGRNPGAGVVESTQGAYPMNVQEFGEAMNRHSFIYRPVSGSVENLQVTDFVLPPGKTSLYTFSRQEMEQFVVSGNWGYSQPRETDPRMESTGRHFGGYYYPPHWAHFLTIYFYIDPRNTLTFRGLQADDPLTCGARTPASRVSRNRKK